MAKRTPRRSEWRRTKTGCWSCSFGERGARIRLFQKRTDGMFYREVHLPGRGRDQKALGTHDRTEAARLGRELLGMLLVGGTASAPRAPEPIRLGELWRRYERECPLHLDNTPHSRADAASRAPVLLGFFGEHRDVRTLSPHDVAQYEAARRAGGILRTDGKRTKAVRQRSAQADLKLLKQMLRWACTCPAASGGRWLDIHPLEYVRLHGEPDPQRPVATLERFESTRAAIRARQERYAGEARSAELPEGRRRAEARRLTWVRAELALVLLEATGRRRGSIAHLQWSDIDCAGRRITWQGAHDKKRRTRVVPYPPGLFDELRDFQRRLGAAGGFLFPRKADPNAAAPAELLSQWIAAAEADAGLPKLAGGLTHTYRRKWRSERTRHPLKAVAEAGGWADITTMLRCYDQPDEDDLLAVTSEPAKRRAGPVALAT